jgi:hypothetical protein
MYCLQRRSLRDDTVQHLYLRRQWRRQAQVSRGSAKRPVGQPREPGYLALHFLTHCVPGQVSA